ncbi:NFX1-type zinc finger-containing protein 1-like [Rhinoraja longicauda]
MLPLGILHEKELAPEMQADVCNLGLSSIPLWERESGIILEWLEIPQHLWEGTDGDTVEQTGGRPVPSTPDTSPTSSVSSVPSPSAERGVFTVLDGGYEDGSEAGERPCSAQQWAREKFAYVLGENARDKAESTIQKCLSDHSVMSAEEVQKVGSIWKLPLDHRWRLYRKWRAAYQEKLNATMNEKLEQYESLAQDLSALDLEETLMLLGGAAVVGMTTPGTARYRTLLQRVRPRVVILEEAAEILEAQVMTMLSPDCQHLIMINDQPQLRPKVADQELAARTHLDMSLFERMVRNHIPFVQLRQQHRKGSDVSQRKFHPTPEDHRSYFPLETHIREVAPNSSRRTRFRAPTPGSTSSVVTEKTIHDCNQAPRQQCTDKVVKGNNV